MAAQWVHLGDQVVVAGTDGARIGRPDFGSLSFVAPMREDTPSSVQTTRHLLDGAIAAAEQAALRDASAEASPEPMTARRWAWLLAGQWYSAHHSIALMPLAARRFEREGRADLAAFAAQKLADEEGHDELPLADLRALGYDAEALVTELPPDPGVRAGVEYAREVVRGPNPVEFLGYMYALERRMMRIPEEWLRDVEHALVPRAAATAGIRLHAGNLDVEHVEEAVAFISGLPATDRAAIAIGCNRITRIRCEGLLRPQPSEHQLDEWLSPFAPQQSIDDYQSTGGSA